MSLRYCGPFQILERVGLVAYKLELPVNVKVHNLFHISLLKRCVANPKHIIDWNVVQVVEEGEFQPEPLHILDQKEVIIRNRTIVQVKV